MLTTKYIRTTIYTRVVLVGVFASLLVFLWGCVDSSPKVSAGGGGPITYLATEDLGSRVTAKLIDVQAGAYTYTFLVVSNWNGGLEISEIRKR
jgi:hypothetical protein